jgi:tetratricopeptide (TPR) repeat protein
MNRAEKRRQQKLAKKAARKKNASSSGGDLIEPPSAEVQQLLDTAVQHHTAGRLPEAEKLYDQVLQVSPTQPVALHLRGVVFLQMGKIDLAVELISKAIASKPDYADAHANLGNALRKQGKMDEAVGSFKNAISVNPDHVDALSNLGNVLRDLNRYEEAIDSYRRALIIKPDFADGHFNLGNTFKKLEMFDEAASSYSRSLAIKPENAEAFNNLGNVLQSQGKFNEALSCFEKAIAIKPDHTMARINLGSALREVGRFDEALESCRAALAIKPDLAEAHHNLGVVFNELGNHDEAISSYRTALDLNSEYVGSHNNLGMILQTQGKLDEALSCFRKALTIDADSVETQKNLGDVFLELGRHEESLDHFVKAIELDPDTPTNLINLLKGGSGLNPGKVIEQVRALAPESVRPDMLAYALSCNKPDENAERLYKEASKRVEIQADKAPNFEPCTDKSRPSPGTELPNQGVALLQWGRSGTGFMHSLFDNHPQISTIPGYYMAGFFGPEEWKGIASSDRREMIRRFMEIYDVVFDAHSPKPLRERRKLGIEEGYNMMGENKDWALSLDREMFSRNLFDLLSGCDRVSQVDFFKMVHAAFDKTMGHGSAKDLIFYHLHNPTNFELINYLNQFKNSKLLLAVREPLQSCESWMAACLDEELSYSNLVKQILDCLFKFDQVPYRFQESRGLRLEDIKLDPQQTMARVCEWLGIEVAKSLFESTFQGLRWWGEPSSIRFGRTSPVNGFGLIDDKEGGDPIKRKGGYLFSEKDQLILGTLFNPFQVLFGYTEKNEAVFQSNLSEIRPLLDEPFDFEMKFIEKVLPADIEISQNSYFQLLRSALKDRWATLETQGTYPHMIQPV